MARLAVVAIFACVSAQSHDYKALWEQFKRDYEKPYLLGSSEEAERFGVFKTNVDIITAVNAQKLSYHLGINQFADLTNEEFAQTYARGLKPKTVWGDLPTVPFPNITGKVLADSVDWVETGKVTPVKNQGHCGSCWAFSTTAAVEGAYAIASGKLVPLSEENLVQCDHSGDQGCSGGLMDNAFGWIKQNGICSEADDPYTSGSGTEGMCKSCQPVVTITGFVDVPPKDEAALKAAVAKGPVSIAVEADQFQHYKGGILDDAACGTKLDHGVVIVGYGHDGNDYWKVRNSWGSSWGEEGHIRIVRGKDMCGLAMEASYPTGAKAAGPGPSPGPSPPSPPTPPTPPTPSSSHYEDPKDGCQAGEQKVQLQDIKGAFCSPACSETQCPTDVPSGVTARPECALEDRNSNKYCALICNPESNECGAATCKSIHGAGICTYDDDGPSPGPSPPSPGDDCFESDDEGACEAKATDGCHWCEILGFGICLPIECPMDGRNSTRLVTMAFSPRAKSIDAIVV